MCGRFTLTAPAAIGAAFGVAISGELAPRYNIAPTQPILVVRRRDGGRELTTLRWGLRPAWASAPMINARVETVATKPSFREAFHHRRCLVPADGFYEWQRADGRKLPYYLHPTPAHLLAFAGLWTDDAVAILTGPADEVVAPIHDRMPLVVPATDYAAWLDPDLPGEAARALLAGPRWQATEVTSRVNRVAHDDAACLAPATPSAPSQGSLF